MWSLHHRRWKRRSAPAGTRRTISMFFRPSVYCYSHSLFCRTVIFSYHLSSINSMLSFCYFLECLWDSLWSIRLNNLVELWAPGCTGLQNGEPARIWLDDRSSYRCVVHTIDWSLFSRSIDSPLKIVLF